MRKVSAALHDEQLAAADGMHIDHRRRKRRLCVPAARNEQHGAADARRIAAQILVDDLFIALPHEERETSVLLTPEVALGILRRDFSDGAIAFHAQLITCRAPRHDARATRQHRAVKHVPAREAFDGDPAAEGMRHDVRECNAQFVKRRHEPVGIVLDRPRRRERLRAAEARKIQRCHTVELGKITYLRVKILFGGEIAVQKYEIFPLAPLHIGKFQPSSLTMTRASSPSE